MFDLRARLGRWLARVRRGETLVVTRRGVPVAKLVPLHEPKDRDRRREAAERLKHFAPGSRLPDGLTIKDLIEEGRKW
jgi:prevent-host-death family protein